MSVVRLPEWSWPGVAFGGQEAAGMARMLRWAANLLGDDPSNPQAVACQTELRLMANSLLACEVDHDLWLAGKINCQTYESVGHKPGPWPRDKAAA